MNKNKDIKISVLLGIIIISVVALVAIPLFYNQFNSSMVLLKDKITEDFKDEEKIAQIYISSTLDIRSNKLSEYVNNPTLIKELENENFTAVKKIIENDIHNSLDSDFLFLTYDGTNKITDASVNILNTEKIIQDYIEKYPQPKKQELYITKDNDVIIFDKEDIISSNTGKILATINSGYIINNKINFISGLSEKINNHNVYFFTNNEFVSGTQEITEEVKSQIAKADYDQLIQVNNTLYYIGNVLIDDNKKLKIVFQTAANYVKDLKNSYISNFILTILISILFCIISMFFANKLIAPPLENLLETINLLLIRNLQTPKEKGIIREFNLIQDNFIDVYNKFQQKKSQLAKFINSSPISILILDYKGNIIQLNQASVDLFLITDREGNILKDSALSENSQFKQILNSLKERPDSFEKELNFKSGNTWKNTTWTFTQDRKENYIFIQCIDNTERVETQAQIEAERSKSIHNQKLAALGEIASSIAHEINNPMGIITLSLTILEDEISFIDIENEDKKKRISKSIENIESSVNRTSQIISNLLDFSREGSKDKFESKNLNTIISKTLIFIEEKMKKNKVHLDTSNLDTSIKIRVKETQFSQTLVNLINNSIDAMVEQEERVISISTEIKDKKCIINFRDTGPGIPKDIEKEVFSAFYTTKEKGKGTGLGLSISKDLMIEMSGDLELVRSEKGAHFIVSIPLGNS